MLVHDRAVDGGRRQLRVVELWDERVEENDAVAVGRQPGHDRVVQPKRHDDACRHPQKMPKTFSEGKSSKKNTGRQGLAC